MTVESLVAPATEIGIVYGPLPTRISLGGLRVIRAGVTDGGAAGAGTAGVVAAGAGAAAGVATGAGGVAAGASGGGENT